MHGYCKCGKCNEEWAGRNQYWESDETPPRHYSTRDKRHECKKNKGGPHKYEKQEPLLTLTYEWEGKTVRVYRINTICVCCTKIKHWSTNYVRE